MIASVLLLGLLAISASGLPTDAVSERAQQVVEATNIVGMDILKALPNRENAIISPLSIVKALSMLYAGARGSTARELRTALRFDNLENNNVHPAIREILDRLTTPSNKYTLDVAIKAFIKSDVTVLQEYENILENYYQAELEKVDFQKEAEAVKNQVDDWVDQKTRGKINFLLEKAPNKSTALLLVNAVYFKGTWQTRFNTKDTRPDIFYNNGQESNQKVVAMMHLETAARYDSNKELDSQVLELPYAGDQLSMVFFLPKRRNGLDELEQKLTNENLQKAIKGLEETRALAISIPKFKFVNTYELKEALISIGINESFQKEANFKGITKLGGIQLSDVIHKAVVEVNEEGSKAAVVSNNEIFPSVNLLSIPTFHADHPFLFAIRERKTGLVLFLGRVNNL